MHKAMSPRVGQFLFDLMRELLREMRMLNVVSSGPSGERPGPGGDSFRSLNSHSIREGPLVYILYLCTTILSSSSSPSSSAHPTLLINRPAPSSLPFLYVTTTAG